MWRRTSRADEIQTPHPASRKHRWIGLETGIRAQESGWFFSSLLALTAMHLAWRGTDCRVPGLVDGLVRWLSGGTAAAHAAAWALGWMAVMSRHPEFTVKVTPIQLSALVEATNRVDLDSEALRWLCEIFSENRTQGAVAALLQRLPHSSAPTQAAILRTLGAIGDRPGIEAIPAYLQVADESVRRAALGGLALTCDDEADRRLLCEHFEKRFGGLDPLDLITKERVATAAQVLRIPKPEIRQRYERLAERFGLLLEWTPRKKRPGSRRRS
jgi:HEAT repeat protein